MQVIAKKTVKRDKDATRESILAAARQLISEDGPEAMSIVRVAKMAGVNRGTAYQHFPDRESLVKAAVQSVSDMLIEAVFPSDGDAPRYWGDGDLVQMAQSMAGFMADNAQLCRVWLFEILSLEKPTEDSFGARYLEEVGRATDVDTCQPNIDPQVFAIIGLMSYLIWPIWNHAERRSRYDRKALTEQFVVEMLRLCLYGLVRPEDYPNTRAFVAEKLAARKPRKVKTAEPRSKRV